MRKPVSQSMPESRFKNLFEQYYAPFCLYARRFINEGAVCEDIVSDVFAALWRKRDELELEPSTTIAYLKTSVRNNCLNYLKHQNHVYDYEELCKVAPPMYEMSPDSVYTLMELYEMLHASLNKLPENYRKVFTLYFFEGKTHAEIAQEMDLSVKSIDRYKQKVMEMLRAELKDYLPCLILLQMLCD